MIVIVVVVVVVVIRIVGVVRGSSSGGSSSSVVGVGIRIDTTSTRSTTGSTPIQFENVRFRIGTIIYIDNFSSEAGWLQIRHHGLYVQAIESNLAAAAAAAAAAVVRYCWCWRHCSTEYLLDRVHSCRKCYRCRALLCDSIG